MKKGLKNSPSGDINTSLQIAIHTGLHENRRCVLRRIILVLSLVAMLALVAVPAIAQVELGVGDQASESGGVEQEFSVANEGDNSNQCVGFQGFGNTGNLQNSQGALQYASVGDTAFEGGGFAFGPESELECTQAVEQASAASSF